MEAIKNWFWTNTSWDLRAAFIFAVVLGSIEFYFLLIRQT